MQAASASSAGGGDDHDDSNNNNHANNPQKQPAASKKHSKGRRKIVIKRIESERARLSTFSKRRSGIYKKANEIATLCGAQVGVAGITPAGRPFSYGSPSVEAIIQHYLHPEYQRQGIDAMVESIVEAHRRTRVENLNTRHDELVDQLEEVQDRLNRLVHINSPFENMPNPNWLDIADASDIPDEQLDAAAEELQDITSRAAEIRQMRERPHIMMPPPAPAPAPATAQPLQAAVAPEIMNAVVDPCADVIAPTNSADVVAATNSADEVVDEEELMLRFFGSYPSTPPGPF